jgi:hypothetical protein
MRAIEDAALGVREATGQQLQPYREVRDVRQRDEHDRFGSADVRQPASEHGLRLGHVLEHVGEHDGVRTAPRSAGGVASFRSTRYGSMPECAAGRERRRVVVDRDPLRMRCQARRSRARRLRGAGGPASDSRDARSHAVRERGWPASRAIRLCDDSGSSSLPCRVPAVAAFAADNPGTMHHARGNIRGPRLAGKGRAVRSPAARRPSVGRRPADAGADPRARRRAARSTTLDRPRPDADRRGRAASPVVFPLPGR